MTSVRIGAAGALLASMLVAGQAFAASSPASVTRDTVVPGTAAQVNKSTPEFEAFRKAWQGLTNYSLVVVSHETSNDGKHSEDRTYDYKFVKPSVAQISIIAGPGKGGGAVWQGGPTIKGHRGGLLSHITLTIAKDDPRALSLRGNQIEYASFGYELDHYASTPGTLAESKGADGNVAITFTPNAAENTGVTREVLSLSPSMNLPVKREQFVGDKSVSTETFSNVKLNDPSLTAKDIN